MRNVFTRAIISPYTALRQTKRAKETFLILLALTVMGFGIAGFLALLKKIHPDNQHLSPVVTTTNALSSSNHSQSLLNNFFPSLQLSCSPLLDMEQKTGDDSNILWHGICRSLSSKNSTSYRLTLSSSPNKRKRFNGFKLAQEVFYLFNNHPDEGKLNGKFAASGFSTFALGGATFLKAKSMQNHQRFYIVGIGLGFGLLIDRKMQIDLSEISSSLSAKN